MFVPMLVASRGTQFESCEDEEMQEQELKTLSSFRILWKASVLDAYPLYLYNMHFNYIIYLLLALILMGSYLPCNRVT